MFKGHIIQNFSLKVLKIAFLYIGFYCTCSETHELSSRTLYATFLQLSLFFHNHQELTDFFSSRCPVDSTVQFHSGGIQQKRFSFLAFNFLQRVSTIYMHCESYICHKASQNSRCTSGCGINKVSRRKRDLEKREIQDEPSKLYVVDNGPIQKSPQKFESKGSL